MIQDKNEAAKGIDKYLHQSTIDFLHHLETYQNESRELFLDSLIKLLDNIITNPYVDKYRLINPDYQSEPIIYKQAFLAGFFKRVGFIEEKNGKQQIFYYPYNAPIPALITVQTTLRDFGKVTGIKGDIIDIKEMTSFDNFLKLRNFLAEDLLKKECKPERIALGLNLDELRVIFAEINIRTAQQLLIMYKNNPEELEAALVRIVSPKRRAEHVIKTLKEFWNELEFLRTTAFYIYSCFADKVSSSFLNDTNDNNSQISRRFLSLSILQAQTLVKINKASFLNLRDLLIEYLKWYCLENDDPSREQFYEQIGKGLLGRDKVHEFLENLELMLCERITQQDKTRSLRLRSENYKNWCISQPLFLETSQDVYFSKDISKWFHSEIVNDYYYMTFATQLITTNSGFRVTFDRLAINKFLFEPKKPETDFFSKEGLENQKKFNNKIPSLENYGRFLYKGLVPANLYACVVNRHFEILKELINNGIQMNIRDHKGRTLLHYAAFMGFTEIAAFLIQKGIDINSEDELGKTPFEIAFENKHFHENTNVCALLIKHGINPSLKIWDFLIETALKTDFTTFLDLALKKDIPFISSLHSAILKIPIKHKSIKVLKFLHEKCDHDTIKKLALNRDIDDKNSLDYAFETQDEEIINLVEKIIGNEFISAFPEIVKNQESQIDYNQQILATNLKQLKEVDETNRLANLGFKADAGNLLPSTLMMLSHEPEPFDLAETKQIYYQSLSNKFNRFSKSSSQNFDEPTYSQPSPQKNYGEDETYGNGYIAAQTSFHKFLREPVAPAKPREGRSLSNIRNNRAKYPAINTRMDSLDNSYNDEGSKSLIYEKRKLPPLSKAVLPTVDKPFSSSKNPEDFNIESKTEDLYLKDLENLLEVATQRRIEEENKLRKQKEQGCSVQ